MEDRLITCWNFGIDLWERNGAYLEAMQVWEQGLEEYMQAPEEDAEEDSHQPHLDPRRRREALPKQDGSNNVTELFLFLAGCFLDAEQFPKARRYCQWAWQHSRQCCAPAGSSPQHQQQLLEYRILLEYMAAFEEDYSVAEPWKASFQIAQQAQRLLLEEQEDQQEENHTKTLASYWRSPYQRPAFNFAIPTPFTNPAPRYPDNLSVCPRDLQPAWCRGLEEPATFAMIQNEFLQLVAGDNGRKAPFPHHWPTVGAGSHRQGAGSHDGSVVRGGDWREWVLFGTGSNDSAAPQTRAWIRRNVPEAVELAERGGGEVIFSVLRPGTRLTPHCASTNLRWTAHLGLVVPPCSACRLRVAEQRLSWQTGQVLVFDDSYEHEVVYEEEDCHEDGEPGMRAVLLLRFWHPHLAGTPARWTALQQALEWKQAEQQRRYHPPRPAA